MMKSEVRSQEEAVGWRKPPTFIRRSGVKKKSEVGSRKSEGRRRRLVGGFLRPLSAVRKSGGLLSLPSLLFRIVLVPILSLFPTTTAYPLPFYVVQTPDSPRFRDCNKQDIETLTNQLLQDLPNYANRASQSARRLSRTANVSGYVLVAGRPEFAPLTLGPGVYTPTSPTNDAEAVQQVFFTTLERQYVNGKPVELQDFHWLFLVKTPSGWRLATMFSQTGGYPNKKPPTPPRESSDGVIAQAVETWLRDCRAGTGKGKDRD